MNFDPKLTIIVVLASIPVILALLMMFSAIPSQKSLIYIKSLAAVGFAGFMLAVYILIGDALLHNSSNSPTYNPPIHREARVE